MNCRKSKHMTCRKTARSSLQRCYLNNVIECSSWKVLTYLSIIVIEAFIIIQACSEGACVYHQRLTTNRKSNKCFIKPFYSPYYVTTKQVNFQTEMCDAESAHSDMQQGISHENELPNSDGHAKDNHNKEDDTTSLQSKALAVVLYDEDNVLPHQKQSRNFHLAGREFQILQNWHSGGVAAVVWDAAIVLAEYLSDNPILVKGKKVLELGAGTGLVGMVTASLDGNVIVTERADALKYLTEAIALNQREEEWKISAKVLDWTEKIDTSLWHDFDLVLGADIIYIEDTFTDLLNTIKAVAPNVNTKILLSCRIRYARDTKFIHMLKKFYDVEELLYDSKLDIKILSAVSKPMS